MLKLWQAFSRELGAAFNSQHGQPEGETFCYWEKELRAFTEDQLQKGFIRWKKSENTFLSIKLFRSLCEPNAETLGLPSFEVSLKAVILKEWHKLPEAFRVLFAQHRYDLKIRSDAEAKKYFKPFYEDAIKRISQGEEIKMRESIKLESKSGTTHTRHINGPTGNEAMAQLKKMMGMRS